MGPRLVERGKSTSDFAAAAIERLQWGRALVERGKPHPELADDRPCPASMGPRLVERGKRPKGPERDDQSVLQWGRAWLSAERHGRDGLRRGRARFNGAALGRARKAAIA